MLLLQNKENRFLEGEFIKDCKLKVAEIVRPDKQRALQNPSLSQMKISRVSMPPEWLLFWKVITFVRRYFQRILINQNERQHVLTNIFNQFFKVLPHNTQKTYWEKSQLHTLYQMCWCVIKRTSIL